jgi:copper oxidase (laccase) domain-containing protein
MNIQFGSKASELILGIGPMIRSCCYEVGEEMKRHFLPDLFEKGKNGLFLDLPQALIRQALSEDLQARNIHDSGLCTCCIAHLHSYRRDKTAGRLGSFMMLK